MVKFSEDHEWVKLDGDIAEVGISPHAVEQLGDIVFIELPDIGTNVTKGDAVAVFESVKAASDIYSPAGGEIIDVNSALPMTLPPSHLMKRWKTGCLRSS